VGLEPTRISPKDLKTFSLTNSDILAVLFFDFIRILFVFVGRQAFYAITPS
jgi:hypothetical protein